MLSSRTPRGSTRIAEMAELLTWITSPPTERSLVDRSDVSSTIPPSPEGSMMIESPIANQFSNCMKSPLRMSIRKRCSAKPSTSTSSEAPAIALRPLTPASCAIANSVART